MVQTLSAMNFGDGEGWEEEELGDRFDGSTRDRVDNPQRGSRGLENLLVILRPWMMISGESCPSLLNGGVYTPAGTGSTDRYLLIH